MCDFRQRVRLAHELGKLTRSEELAHGSRNRLGVDEISRHRGLHFLVDRHLLLDGSLHALKTYAELILKEFTNGANSSIPQVIDVISLEFDRVLSHLQYVANHLEEISSRQEWIFDAVTFRLAHL